MAAVTVLTLLFTGISSYAVGVGEVRGGFSTTVTFDDLSDNNISAYPAAGWSFQTANASPSTYKGASCSVFGAGTYTKMGTFNFVNFTVQLWGRITASGSGPGPDTYSITANRQLTVYYIETDKTIIPKGDSQPFYAKEAMLTGPIGPKNSDWTITPAGGGSAITAQGTSWASASDMAAGSYTVSASPTIFAEATSDSKNLKIVEVASVSATYNSTTKTSYIDSPNSITDNETLYVPKGSGSITVTATPNPSGGWPTGKPTWSPNTAFNGQSSYTHSIATAGDTTISATCGSSTKVIKIVVIEITSLARAELKTSRKIASGAPITISASDTSNTITVTTNPTGYENFVTLTVPTGNGTITRDSSNPAIWTYEAPTEAQSYVGVLPSVSFNITSCIMDQNSDKTVAIHLSSVFQYLANDKNTTTNREKAWQYARWKYGISTSGLGTITYDPSQSTSGLTNVYTDNMSLGTEAFSSEWCCASVLGHENIHGIQTWIFIATYPDLSEADASAWELDHSNAPSCTASPTTYIYTYDSSYYNDTKSYYKSHGGTVTYP